VQAANESSVTSTTPSANPYIVLQQNFDNEPTGSVPENWSLTNSSYGYIAVDDTVYYGSSGKSAKFVDNSTVGSPGAYRNFTEQNSTIVVSFSVRLPNNVGNHTGLEVRVDNGTYAGANIIFGNDSIQYLTSCGHLVTLRPSYVANRWYNITFIMNIPDNLYDISIDEHLEVANANFTGHCTQIHRIVINETSTSEGALLPVGYIDNIEVRKGIVIPADFPTIQDGINAASPGDVVIVSKDRTYFENITISKNVWLVGQNSNTTIIDGDFLMAAPNLVTVSNCSHIQIYGFTIRNTAAGGAQVYLTGSNDTISDNIIESGLGDAIRIVGSGNVVANNTIKSNLKCGIDIVGSNSTVSGNVIESNDESGIQICGPNSSVADNVIQSSGQFGIYLTEAKNSVVVNNTIQDNEVGIKCETSTEDTLVYQNRFVGNVKQAIDDGLANEWDDGYPCNLMNKTGGGNYWSDYNGTDLYEGPSQNENGYRDSPSPDGIGDEPYIINSSSIDHYPLFIIQNVTQNPAVNKADWNLNITTGKPALDYEARVTVTAKALNHTNIINAILYVTINGTKHFTFTNVTISGDTLTVTISPKVYGTTVGYIWSVLAYKANWLNSTSYPIRPGQFPYFVGDWTPPYIYVPTIQPVDLNENQTIAVNAKVTDYPPGNPFPGASGIAKVLVSYTIGNTSYTTRMTRLPPPNSDNYTAVIPKQTGLSLLNLTITAFDNAGNNYMWNGNKHIKQLAQLSVYESGNENDPCEIEVGPVSADQIITRNFTIENLAPSGDSTLNWNLNVIEGGAWLVSITPTSGLLPAGDSQIVIITVDTRKCTDASLYKLTLSVNANGTVSQWTVIESFTTRYIIIDQSWASSQAPNRCNVNTPQYIVFHAIWANNDTDAIGCSVTLGIMQGGAVIRKQTNATNDKGWAIFPETSGKPVKETFFVAAVKFDYVTAFKQTAFNRTTIWDCVYIDLSLTRNWINVGNTTQVLWNGSYYESDHTPFVGQPLFNETGPVHYSIGRTSINASANTVGRYPISALSIIDNEYNLTAFESNTVWCTWDEIEIIAGGVSSSQLNVKQTGEVWFTAVYMYQNELFKGANGTLYVNVVFKAANGTVTTNDTRLTWSENRELWTINKTYNTPGTATFTIAAVQDNVHGLTEIKDNVGPLTITWGPKPWWQAFFPSSSDSPAESQSSPAESETPQGAGVKSFYIWPLLIIMLAAVIGMAIPLVLFVVKSGKRHSKTINNKRQKIATENSKH
jgi:parallel beta-helix repeat protein